MNREILFRGQTRKKGEKLRLDGSPVDGNWVYGGVFQGRGDRSLIYAYEDCQKYPVYSETVGQYTGLTDKNGVKIFEGDIIETQTQDTKQLRNAEVRFGEFADINSDEDECYIGFYIVFDGIFTTAGQLKEFSNSIEVIGNIFDHPDLLEENNT